MNLVEESQYPNEQPAEKWISETLARKQAILNAVYSSYRSHDSAIHVDDEMWNGLLLGGSHDGSAARWARMHYFYGGRSAMRVIADSLIAADAPLPARIMDFPCGHGRVLRFLRSAFPNATIYGGDLNQSGVAFCAERFNALPIISQVNLAAVDLPQSLDLIWCGSLATHLPEANCLLLFKRLIDALAPGGVAGITVCARGMDYAQKHIFKTIADAQYERIEKQWVQTGFGYGDYPGAQGYGMTFVDLRWIQKIMDQRTDAYLLNYSEKGWHGGQDIVWIVKRSLSYWYDWAKD
jgi:trans-aconitate methyltransferase